MYRSVGEGSDSSTSSDWRLPSNGAITGSFFQRRPPSRGTGNAFQWGNAYSETARHMILQRIWHFGDDHFVRRYMKVHTETFLSRSSRESGGDPAEVAAAMDALDGDEYDTKMSDMRRFVKKEMDSYWADTASP